MTIKQIEKVPNFDTMSTLIDRLIIENVKKSIFELRLEESVDNDKTELKEKIYTQTRLIKHLRDRLTDYMTHAWLTGEYEYVDETRTFKA